MAQAQALCNGLVRKLHTVAWEFYRLGFFVEIAKNMGLSLRDFSARIGIRGFSPATLSYAHRWFQMHDRPDLPLELPDISSLVEIKEAVRGKPFGSRTVLDVYSVNNKPTPDSGGIAVLALQNLVWYHFRDFIEKYSLKELTEREHAKAIRLLEQLFGMLSKLMVEVDPNRQWTSQA